MHKYSIGIWGIFTMCMDIKKKEAVSSDEATDLLKNIYIYWKYVKAVNMLKIIIYEDCFLFMTSYSNNYTKKSKTKSTLIQCECTHMPALEKKLHLSLQVFILLDVSFRCHATSK